MWPNLMRSGNYSLFRLLTLAERTIFINRCGNVTVDKHHSCYTATHAHVLVQLSAAVATFNDSITVMLTYRWAETASLKCLWCTVANSWNSQSNPHPIWPKSLYDIRARDVATLLWPIAIKLFSHRSISRIAYDGFTRIITVLQSHWGDMDVCLRCVCFVFFHSHLAISKPVYIVLRSTLLMASFPIKSHICMTLIWEKCMYFRVNKL